MKVLFAGTPDFAVAPLKALNQDHQIVGVFTQPDAKVGRGKKLTPPIVKQVAQDLGLQVFQPTELRSQLELIESLAPDVMVVVAYGMLLPQSVLDIPRFGCINIHASILPRWRGAAPIHRAIEAGDAQTGVSIMRMELGLDTGPVYQTLLTDIKPDDTTPSVHDRLTELGAKGICSTLKQLTDNPELQATPQDELGNGLDANYAKKILKTEVELDWSQSAIQIDQRIRAFIPWPICQSHHQTDTTKAKGDLSLKAKGDLSLKAKGSVRIRIHKAALSDIRHNDNARAGEIVCIDDAGVHVQCGTGVLTLKKLQRDGSKALETQEFLNGYPLGIDECFENITLDHSTTA